MNIEEARKQARICWEKSTELIELSPAARMVLNVLNGKSITRTPESSGQRVSQDTFFSFYDQLEELILIDDPSVRVMTLKAMGLSSYLSRHTGLIATFYASEEAGDLLDEDGKKIDSESVSIGTWRYFLEILKVPNFFDDLKACVKHWEGVLNIDYTREFSKVESLDFSGATPKLVSRQVPKAEVKTRIELNKSEMTSLYRQSILRLKEKYNSGYYEQGWIQAYRGLEMIFSYLAEANLSTYVHGAALEMLARVASIKYFPARWLIELSSKYSPN
jgi:hypothetical protein